jgi:type I restriction enzyme S subunit
MVKIKIPPLALIRRFSEYVDRNFQGMEILSQQNQLLKEAREILLPRLMTGMIDVDVDVDDIELPDISA